ncbi:hypothetical protein [Oleiharenicola sp. Vm1]|uniref:hypothetical protein n=1 Tax=Oleiharenicola sp. Vm1 TaxID=3398393 RepID=UPI0039F47724
MNSALAPISACLVSIPFAVYAAVVARRNGGYGTSLGTDVVYGVFFGLAVIATFAALVAKKRKKSSGRVPLVYAISVFIPAGVALVWVFLLYTGQVVSHSGWRLF